MPLNANRIHQRSARQGLDRRAFLRVLAGSAMATSALTCLRPAFAVPGQRRLVLVELSGANDGLNTLVPFKDERYHALRPNLGLHERDLISLNPDFGLHNELQPLMATWEAGELALVQGLGYPAPNRSHFSSIQLWETGGDGNRQQQQGWLTHDIEHRYPMAALDAHGICFDGRMGVFNSASGNWLSMSSATQFSDAPDIQTVQGSTGNPSLDAVLASGRTLKQSIDAISTRMERANLSSGIRSSALAGQMNHVVNMINAGVNTPVLKVSLSGFDTHENQQGRHRNLMRSLAVALGGLRRELKQSGEWDNTLVMTYSEFGRRAGENRSGGTDHGTASVHFVAGGRVKGGLYGNHPDLGQLVDDDLVHTMDYRALYQEVLASWLQIPDNRFHAYREPGLTDLLA
ncbi:MAG: DUF1501 domain-containing protein [Gammaproteobacteria bacterium]|nr:DUF1501 domain-containing protein [Gammaproteobacteria bacterium]